MPELPEVERLARSLAPAILHRTVIGLIVHRRDVITGPADPPGGYARNKNKPAVVAYPRLPRRLLLLHQPITVIERWGKQLALLSASDDNPALVIQLGMTGQLLHTAADQTQAKADPLSHVHLTWTLDDGSTLRFRDPRRFGGVRAYPTAHELRAARAASLGPDALSITAANLAEALAASASPVKARLLDQRAIAGVGNIYADEALYAARIAPQRPACSLNRDEAKRLASALRRILAAAIEAGGSTLRDYRDSTGAPGAFQHQHRVYGRSGQACFACRTPLQHATITGRTTVWCPRCQA